MNLKKLKNILGTRKLQVGPGKNTSVLKKVHGKMLVVIQWVSYEDRHKQIDEKVIVSFDKVGSGSWKKKLKSQHKDVKCHLTK